MCSRKGKELMSQDTANDPCIHLTRPILVDSRPSSSSLVRSVLLGSILHGVDESNVSTAYRQQPDEYGWYAARCSIILNCRLYLFQYLAGSCSLGHHIRSSCSQKTPKRIRGAHSGAIRLEWRLRGAFSYRLCYFITLLLQAPSVH